MEQRKGIIVAIGGGELKDGETLAIDQEIVRLSGKERPHALFVPTASGDSEGYIHTFESVYGKLGCTTEALLLVQGNLADDEIRTRISRADIIYVGGGNTALMMRIWKEKGIDKMLAAAYERGAVLSGLSAGAICWFAYGLSDSLRFSNPDDAFKFITLAGLGIIPCIFSPHHIRDKDMRDPAIVSLMKETRGVAIAADDNSALIIEGDAYRVLSSQSNARMRKVFSVSGQVKQKDLPIQGSLSELVSPL